MMMTRLLLYNTQVQCNNIVYAGIVCWFQAVQGRPVLSNVTFVSSQLILLVAYEACLNHGVFRGHAPFGQHIGKHGLPLCESISGQRKFVPPLHEILNMPIKGWMVVTWKGYKNDIWVQSQRFEYVQNCELKVDSTMTHCLWIIVR